MIRSPVAVKPHVPRIYSIVGDPQPCLVLRLKPSTPEMFSEHLVWTQELALSTLYSVVERILMRCFKLTQLFPSFPSTQKLGRICCDRNKHFIVHVPGV